MRTSPLPELRTLIFHVTNRCNLRCRHCWQSAGRKKDSITPEPENGGIPLEQFHRVLREAKVLGLRDIKFTGGEPFLHPEIAGYLETAGREGLGVVVETNGTLLEESHLALLKKLKVIKVAISLDGANPSSHDSFRGVEGAFGKTLESLGMLARSTLPVQMISCLHEGNYKDMEEILRIAAEYQAGSVKFNPVQPMGLGNRMAREGECLSIPLLLDLADHLRRTARKIFQGQFHFHLPVVFSPCREIQERRISTCRILSILGLLPDGDISFCGIGETTPSLRIGNIYQDRLDSLWSGAPLFHRLRQDLPEGLTGVCSRCILKGLCLGECRAVAHAMTGDLLGPYWICEQALEEGVFPESRLLSEGKEG